MSKRHRQSIKYHIEGNRLLFDEDVVVLNGDRIIIEEVMDEEGKIITTGVWLECSNQAKKPKEANAS
jgi:hypothetical protein